MRIHLPSAVCLLFASAVTALGLQEQTILPTGKNLESSVEWFLHGSQKDESWKRSLEKQKSWIQGTEKAPHDLILKGEGSSPTPGVWGIECRLGPLPLSYNLIVPGRSGVRLTRETPGRKHTFDYPLGWEAQFLIGEGNWEGLYVWADDPKNCFKRLTISKEDSGWHLGFYTLNQAPFESHKTCSSVPWHVNLYEGDWRVPARRYRNWAERHLRPTPLKEQSPSWIQEIRCVVIMELSADLLAPLAERLHPTQTLLYIPSWRKAGYDRDYPVYDESLNALDPFLHEAHGAGFRVMLHVNYFGCDPLNPLYDRFEAHQVRSPWGQHEKRWWLWERTEPTIRFAYINPAYKPWRDLFVDRMVDLCHSHAVDALHLDQTLCIYNDHNGLIEGLSMVQGNILLHKELREALPQVALSGEGLNEVTYRHEAFAQRHAWGVNHADGTFDKPLLKTAHPVCSYLFLPYTKIYGYLGVAPPTEGQLYAAWMEAYEHWGVLPTLKPRLSELVGPTGFSQVFFEEASFWLDNRLEPAMEEPWPETIAFLFRAKDGRTARRTRDHRFLCGEETISRIISDTRSVRLPGFIPGWKVYDSERIFGLDPNRWYPYTARTRDLDGFHVQELPSFAQIAWAIEGETLAMIRTRHRDCLFLDLTEALADALCRSEPFEGPIQEMSGALDASDGGHFRQSGDLLHAHPPWKLKGSGVVRARYRVRLPRKGQLRFLSQVAMDRSAVGPDRTDGVTFGARAESQNQTASLELHQDASDPVDLSLDLTKFAGQEIVLDLTVHPGPHRDPSYDWARWIRPRIEREVYARDKIRVAGAGLWQQALGPQGVLRLHALETETPVCEIEADFPGTLYLLRKHPEKASLPLDLTARSFQTFFLDDELGALQRPQHATAVVQAGTIGGIEREGLFTHPPNRGQTRVMYALSLPELSAKFHAFVGLRDGSQSEGCLFLVEINGVELERAKKRPGEWSEITVDLSPWKGQIVILSLITDSDGYYGFDWAHWGEPRLTSP